MRKLYDPHRLTGTSFKTYLEGVTYQDLISVLGEPSFDEPSGDDKIQVEWAFEVDGKVVTLYDWKTYDREFTTTELDQWHIGGTSLPSAVDFKHHILSTLGK